MIKKDYFKNPELWLEKHSSKNLVGQRIEGFPSMPDELFTACPSCKEVFPSAVAKNDLSVCPFCGFHLMIGAGERIGMIADEGTFKEKFKGIRAKNRLGFPGYDDKLAAAEKTSGRKEAVVCGTCRIDGHPAMICVMESAFIMGSMGSATGEKIAKAFEYATAQKLPVVVFSVSGGARMQEGIFSLMQMAKTSGAVKWHSKAGLLYLSVLTNPTTGGVTASFAMQGDIIIAEPKALIGFAGPRVIEQTIRQKLPEGFQSAGFLLEKGFLDAIVHRKDMKKYISRILRFHEAK